MPQANFGSGDLILIPGASATDQTPIRLGNTLQEVQLDYSETVKELMGAKAFAVAAAKAERKISWKAKMGKLSAQQVQAILDGSTSATGSKIETVETNTLAAHTFTVSGSANFVDDLGVYAADGTPYAKVAASPVGLQYTVSAGVYTFEVATQDGKVLTYKYNKSQSLVGKTVTLTNPDMGLATLFKIELFNNAGANGGRVLGAEMSAAYISKISLPFKNTDFTIYDVEGGAIDDGSGNVIKFYADNAY